MNKKTATEIAITWEMLNGSISDPVKTLLLKQLSAYDDAALLKALARCRAECRGRITPADIIQRIEDGHPGPEEAWAIIESGINNEDATLIWTPEIKHAFFQVSTMTDKIAARKAFIECYRAQIVEARAEQRGPKWSVSLGHNRDQRDRVLFEAVNRGLLSPGYVRSLVPELPSMTGEVQQLPGKEPEYPTQEEVKQLVSGAVDKMGIE